LGYWHWRGDVKGSNTPSCSGVIVGKEMIKVQLVTSAGWRLEGHLTIKKKLLQKPLRTMIVKKNNLITAHNNRWATPSTYIKKNGQKQNLCHCEDQRPDIPQGSQWGNRTQ